MDDFWNFSIKLKKLITKDHSFTWFHLYKISKRGKFIIFPSWIGLKISSFQVIGRVVIRMLLLMWFALECWSVLKLDNSGGVQPCEYTKNHWTANFKFVGIWMCLNKAIRKNTWEYKEENKYHLWTQQPKMVTLNLEQILESPRPAFKSCLFHT